MNIATQFLNRWYDLTAMVRGMTAALVIGAGAAAIVAALLFSILRIRKRNQTLAIIAPTVVSCLMMAPMVSAFNAYVDLQVEGVLLHSGKAELAARRAENSIQALEREKLENQLVIGKQAIEIEALNDSIAFLENAALSMESFQKILQVALLETNLKQTMVRKELITPFETGWGLRANYYADEILVALTHDINAKFGVDLNDIKIVKIDDDNVVVSGIRPAYIGSDRNISSAPVKEIRRVNYKRGVEASVEVAHTPESIRLADRYADQFEAEFQTKLSEGLELGFMHEAVVTLAKNFITVMLAPLYKNIAFSDAEQPDALPITRYLQAELEENQRRKAELLEQ